MIYGDIRIAVTRNKCINERHLYVKGDTLTNTMRQPENGAK